MMGLEKILTAKEFFNTIKKFNINLKCILPDFESYGLGKKNQNNDYSRIVINEKIEINKNVSWDFRVIQDVTFNSIVKISNADIKSGLVFINCIFKKGVVFREVTSTNFDTAINTYNSSVLFSNCKGASVVFNDNCVFERGIIFDNNSEFDKICIYNTIIESNRIKFSNTLVKKLLDINNVQSQLTIESSSNLKGVKIVDLTGDISFLSSNFDGSIIINNTECPNSFVLNKNTFKDTFSIKACKLKRLSISGDTFYRKAELENRDDSGNGIETYCKDIYITEAVFKEGFYFEGMDNPIEKITLKLSPNFKGLAKFNNWRVDKFELWGVCQDLKLLFKNMTFRYLLINDFTNYSDISFDKCKAISDSPFYLNDCDLGTTKFNEFDFKSFDKISVDNAILNKIKITNVNWFDDDTLEIASEGDETEKNRRKRDIYRQIKYALVSSGNKIDSLLFKAREMKAYRDELYSKDGYKWSEDWAIMGISKTNNFGMSWWKPTWIIFLITLLFYTIMLPLFSEYKTYSSISPYCISNYNSINNWLTNFDVFWQLFNPTRKFSSVYGNVDSGLLHFFDLLQRVILGIFIFQIIKGFRKLNSK